MAVAMKYLAASGDTLSEGLSKRALALLRRA